MNEERWYYASYSARDENGEELYPDGNYFEADSDEQAIETAKILASEGQDYSDIGHVDLDLISVCRVDPEKEWDEIETLWVDNDKKREEIYKEALRSCDSRQWVKLIKTSYQRNQARIKRGKKATTSDERYLHLAEDNLFGELAIPFEMTKGEAENYFIEHVCHIK